MEGKLIVGVVSIVVGIILVGSMLAPAIQMVSGGAWDETVTTTYNEDPDLTFDRLISDFALDITVTFGDDISIVNGEDTVTATIGPMFLLAADNSAVFINTADEIILVWTDTDGTQSVILQGDFTAAIADGKLTIDDGTSYDLPLPTSYLYVPSSTGQYGSFPDGELTKRAEDPVIAAGSFAGVVGYNTSVTLVGDAMQMEVVGNDTTITEVNWIAAVEELDPQMIDFDPGQITIQPLDPSIIDLEPDVSIMTVPTPDYTDGDWGYNKINSTTAVIVSYSGSDGDIVTIPSTVGGFTVKQIGKGTSQSCIFNTSTAINKLIIPDGVEKINAYALQNCGSILSVEIPDSVTTIGKYAFQKSGLSGTLVIPDSVTSIDIGICDQCHNLNKVVLSSELTTITQYCFRLCDSLIGSFVIPDTITTIAATAFNACTGDTIVIPSSVTSIGVETFYSSKYSGMVIAVSNDCSIDSTTFNNTVNLKEVLNLGSLELTTTSYGLNADTIQDHIDAEAYIAPATITEVIHHSGGGGEYSGFYEIILVVTVVAILIAAAGLMIYRRSL